MLVTYVTIEDICSGLFQTQILDIVNEILTQEGHIEYEIIIINRPWKIFKHLKKKYKYKIQNKDLPIRFRYLPILPPLRYAVDSILFSTFVSGLLTSACKIFISKSTVVVHSRSYWATYASIKSQNKPVIFDMRSLWPAENISAGKLTEGSKAEKYWKNLERFCLNEAAISTGVTSGMVKYVKSIAPKCKASLIPISVDIRKFMFHADSRAIRRKELGWDDKIILVYSGSLGLAGINRTTLAEMLQQLLAINENINVLFLSMENAATIDKMMFNKSINTERYKIIQPAMKILPEWLSAGDIGVHALPKQLDSFTRLGTKVVEYWANGLPIIVNEFVGAAVEIINEFEVGYVHSIGDSKEETSDKIRKLLGYNREQITLFAQKMFSLQKVAAKYLEVYKNATFINSTY